MRTIALVLLLLSAVLASACATTRPGDQALAQGDHAQALALYREALAKEPGSVALRQRIGMAYFAMPDYAQAEASFLNVLEIAPSEPDAIFYLGLSRLGKGEREAGLDLLTTFRLPGKHARQKFVQEEITRLRNHPEVPAKEAIRSLRDALNKDRIEQSERERETFQGLGVGVGVGGGGGWGWGGMWW